MRKLGRSGPISLLFGFGARRQRGYGRARLRRNLPRRNLGQRVIVENRPGAGGVVATLDVAKAQTRRLHHHAASGRPDDPAADPGFLGRLTIRAKDFTPIVLLGDTPEHYSRRLQVSRAIDQRDGRVGERKIPGHHDSRPSRHRHDGASRRFDAGVESRLQGRPTSPTAAAAQCFRIFSAAGSTPDAWLMRRSSNRRHILAVDDPRPRQFFAGRSVHA